MVCAMVKVLPEPVTPSSTWCLSPRSRPSVSSPMARCWSPASSKSDTRLKRSYREGIRTVNGTRGWGAGASGVRRSAFGVRSLAVLGFPVLGSWGSRFPVRGSGFRALVLGSRFWVRDNHPFASFAPCALCVVCACGLGRSAQSPEQRREVAAARAGFHAAPLRAHFDLPPLAVALLVGRDVAERVLRADLGEHFLVDGVELFHGGREKRAAAGDVGDLLQDQPLLVPDAARLMFELANRVDGHVR